MCASATRPAPTVVLRRHPRSPTWHRSLRRKRSRARARVRQAKACGVPPRRPDLVRLRRHHAAPPDVMPKQWQESGPEPQRWRLWYGARGQQQSWRNHGKGQEKGSKGAKAAGSFPAYDAKPPATVKSKLDKLEPEGIEPADGLVPGMQKALNHARRMEGRLQRLLKDKQTAMEQWEQYKKDAQKAFYNEKARFMQAQENFDKEIATAVVAQKEAREQLCAMVDVANNPRMSEEPAIDNEWDRMLVDYEEERQGTMTGVLERALQDRKQWLAQTAALVAAHQTELDMKALRTMARGRQPHLGANTLPDGPTASGLLGNGAPAPAEKPMPVPGADVPYLGHGPPGPFQSSPGALYLKQTANVSPCARVGPYEGKPAELEAARAASGLTDSLDLAQNLANNRAATPFGLGLAPGFATIRGGQNQQVHTIPIQVDNDEGLSDDAKPEDPGGHKAEE